MFKLSIRNMSLLLGFLIYCANVYPCSYPMKITYAGSGYDLGITEQDQMYGYVSYKPDNTTLTFNDTTATGAGGMPVPSVSIGLVTISSKGNSCQLNGIVDGTTCTGGQLGKLYISSVNSNGNFDCQLTGNSTSSPSLTITTKP